MDTSVAPHRKMSVDSLSGAPAHGYSENNLNFICKFWAGPLQTAGDDDCCTNEHYESVSVVLPAQCSIYQLRLRISMKVWNRKLEGLMHPQKKAVYATKYDTHSKLQGYFKNMVADMKLVGHGLGWFGEILGEKV